MNRIYSIGCDGDRYRAENGYYTVVIPYSETRTEWHPADRVGPFSVLTRGCFLWPAAAHAWARRSLGGQPYSVRYQRAYAALGDLYTQAEIEARNESKRCLVLPAQVVR